MSLSELVRQTLDGQRPRASRAASRAPPPVEPALLRELARLGNNLNQLVQVAQGQEPVTAVALLVRLIEIDRELGALRRAHERPAEGSTAGGEGGAAAEPTPSPPAPLLPARAEPPVPAAIARLTLDARLARARRRRPPSEKP